MWTAFRTGSAWRGWAGRCGHRLTAHYIGRVSRRQAASTPDTRHRQTHALGLLSVITITHCASIRRRKCLRLRLVARHGRRLRKRIRQSPLQSGIGLLRRTDTRLAFHCVCPMLSQACSATPVASRWHTLRRQSAGSSFPFPASPMLCRWRVKGCRRREPIRSPPLCSSHVKRFTAL